MRILTTLAATLTLGVAQAQNYNFTIGDQTPFPGGPEMSITASFTDTNGSLSPVTVDFSTGASFTAALIRNSSSCVSIAAGTSCAQIVAFGNPGAYLSMNLESALGGQTDVIQSMNLYAQNVLPGFSLSCWGGAAGCAMIKDPPAPTAAPEIDGAVGFAALTLLIGAAMVLRAWR